MDLTVVVLNGYPRSGKDTFVQFCKDAAPESTEVHQISTVDPAKQALRILGWDNVKTNPARDALSTLKDMSVELFDGPYKYIQNRVVEWQSKCSKAHLVVFIDSREPEEIQRFKDSDLAVTVFVSRAPKDLPSNHADNRVEHFDYDVTIDNNGTLEQLAEKARHFIQEEVYQWKCV